MKWTPIEPEFKQMVTDKISGNHFTNFLGIEINSIDAGNIEATLILEPHHMQQMDFIHGGVTATMADVVMGFAAFTLVKKGNGVVTVDLKVSYMNPGIGPLLYAKGFVTKAGQRLFFCESELYSRLPDRDILIAKATSIMSMVTPEEIKR
ncbi:MAG: PaaI family thioesterase [Bacteroidia bacterium]|jgi:uncharacterized protein (TIGR00369 family)